MRDALAGKQTYSEFQATPEKIPTNILADRLKRLVEFDILNKKPSAAPNSFFLSIDRKRSFIAPCA
ncbi:winged helix-turn-helix transcriptional regulator [Nitrosomonas marina]|uniref:winged helix-turn-helix transcriptional regulator n=1 Tax=Nitrosomonas marina TaxID=917 RepID=UPI002481AE68|nr:hypothetical protein [Nitrosomonas marina]